MIDLVLYRSRIGSFNQKVKYNKFMRYSLMNINWSNKPNKVRKSDHRFLSTTCTSYCNPVLDATKVS